MDILSYIQQEFGQYLKFLHNQAMNANGLSIENNLIILILCIICLLIMIKTHNENYAILFKLFRIIILIILIDLLIISFASMTGNI